MTGLNISVDLGFGFAIIEGLLKTVLGAKFIGMGPSISFGGEANLIELLRGNKAIKKVTTIRKSYNKSIAELSSYKILSNL